MLLVPSKLDEGFPYVIREGLAAGTCILASDVGGINELLTHKTNAVLFQKNNIMDFIEKMCCLIENNDKRNAYAYNGYNVQFSKESKRYSELVQDLTN